jgi:hypothetical protein
MGWLFLLEILACVGLAAWWVSLPAATRLMRLGVVMVQEHVPTVVPEGLVVQAEWLYHHRRQRLTGMSGLLVVAGMIGLGEGVARRQTSPLGGFMFTWWWLGRVGLVLMPGAVGGYLIAPWPLPGRVVASALAVSSGIMVYGLACGRPYIP